MLSKNKQKLITSLAKKKYRDQEKLFIAEGHKLVQDLLNTPLKCAFLIATGEWINSYHSIRMETEVIDASENELKKITSLKSVPPVIAVFQQPHINFEAGLLNNKLSIFLDDVQDPGNLGTIVRLADWFGIENIICTKNCADIYNPKTVQSTMGAIARIKVNYVDKLSFFESLKPLKIPVYGTFPDGQNLYDTATEGHGIIVMGNEGKGISPEVERYIISRLSIPSYPHDAQTSESLNVAVATAIICSEFRRRVL